MINLFKRFYKRFELKYWEPGDVLILENLSLPFLVKACIANGGKEPVATLLSFSKKEACVSLFNKEDWYINLESVNNITAQARKRKKRIEKYMNCDYSDNSSTQLNTPTFALDLQKLTNKELKELIDVFCNNDNFEVANIIKNVLVIRSQQITEKE